MINWGDIWKHQMPILDRWITLQTEFWGKIADYETENRLLISSDLAYKQLELIKLGHEDTLLEIDPGCGRLTIPLAKRARSITAIEPSKRTLMLLMERTSAVGLCNINYINKR